MSKKVEDHVLKEYALVQQMGSGAYGHVWEVQERKSKKKFALKKVFDAFRNSIDAQRTYRQVQILKQLDCEHIVRLFKVMKSKNKKDLYLIFQFMQADLHSVVGSNILQKMHQVFVFYQILKGLKYIHSAELIHRDLKPSNILLNSECQAKLCDFGLVRTLNASENEEAILSEEVATKWYRAPELLLGSRSYGKPIDVWSFGCIVAQILTGKPMFAGDSTLNQLEKIIEYTGAVNHEDIESLDSPVADQLITQIKVKKKSFREYFSSVDPDFWVLLKGTLEFNPDKRMTIEEVLDLELFDEFREEIKQLKNSKSTIKLRIDDNVRFNLKVYRQKIYQEIDKKQRSESLKQKKQTGSSHNFDKRSQKSTLKRRTTSQQKPVSLQNNPLKVKKRSSNSQSKQNLKPLRNRNSSVEGKNRRNYHSVSTLPSNYSSQNPYVSVLLRQRSLNSAKTSLKSLKSKERTIVPSRNYANIQEKNRIRKQFQQDKGAQNKKLYKKRLSKKDLNNNFSKKNILKSIGFF